jgi:hypothetical protein
MWPFRKKSDAFQRAIDTHIDDDFAIFAAGEDAPNHADIEIFERSIGFRLPEDFRRYSCSPGGGVFVDAKPAIWPRTQTAGAFWTFLTGLFVYGFSSNIPERMSIILQTETFRRESQTDYVPCLKILMDPDIYCFDRDGKLRRWHHETGDAPLQAKTFTEVFVAEIAELRRSKDRMVSQRQSIKPSS